MSSFEWNKIIASVLTATIVAMVAGILASQLVRPQHLEKLVYVPPGAEAGATVPAAAPAQAAAPEPIAPALAKADPAKGQQITKVCQQCHTFAKGQPNKIGPNLYDIMEENIASVPGYQFSNALAADKAKKWTPDELNVWLWQPQDFAHGTKMTFPGLPKVQDRADVITYLATLSSGGAAAEKALVARYSAAAKAAQKKPAAPAAKPAAPAAKPAAPAAAAPAAAAPAATPAAPAAAAPAAAAPK